MAGVCESAAWAEAWEGGKGPKEEIGSTSRTLLTRVNSRSQVSSMFSVQGTCRKCCLPPSGCHRCHKSKTTVRTEGQGFERTGPYTEGHLKCNELRDGEEMG